MAESLTVSVVTPEGPLFSGEATFVAAPAWDGEIGILPRHAALIAALGTGDLRLHVVSEGAETVERFAVRGGFLQVLEDHVSLLVTQAVGTEGLDEEALATEHGEVLEELRHPKSDERYEELLDDRAWIETRQKIRAP